MTKQRTDTRYPDEFPQVSDGSGNGSLALPVASAALPESDDPARVVADLVAKWPPDRTGLQYVPALNILKAAYPSRYRLWTAPMLSVQLRSAGVRTRNVRRGHTVRQGTYLADLKAVLGQARRVVADSTNERFHLAPRRPLVYFAERDGFVKIGTTTNLAARLCALNRGDSAIGGMMISPIHLLATMPGGDAVERSLHDLFLRLRYDGEWFLLDEPLSSFIAAVAAAGAP